MCPGMQSAVASHGSFAAAWHTNHGPYRRLTALPAEYMPDGALQARARVLNYIKARGQPLAIHIHLHARGGETSSDPSRPHARLHTEDGPCCPTCPMHRPLLMQENHLLGATPFATFVHMGLHNQAAWNATALAATSALLADSAGDSAEEFEAALAQAAGPALDSLHKVVCIAYYLPDK